MLHNYFLAFATNGLPEFVNRNFDIDVPQMHLVKKATPTLFILLNAIKKGTTESFIYQSSEYPN